MMNKWYMSSVSYNAVGDVDIEKAVLKNIVVVTEGEAQGHDVFLDSRFLVDVVRLGNEKKQGLKMRFGHPNMSSTALGDFLGRAKNFRLASDGKRVLADAFLANSAKEAPGGNLHEYVLQLAKEDKNAFGMSIVFTQERLYQIKDNEKVFDNFDKEEKTYVEIKNLHAVDFVDDPAANPDGLFSAWNSMTMSAQVTEFLDLHPEVMGIIEKNPDIILDFVDRYKTYLKRKGVVMDEGLEKVSKLSERMSDILEEAAVKNHKEEKVSAEAAISLVDDVLWASENELKNKIKNVKILMDNEDDKEADEKILKLNQFAEVCDFIRLADAEGYEFAKEHFGKDEMEILTLKNKQLRKENEDLKKNIGAEPLMFSDSEEKKQDFRDIVESHKSNGLSSGAAWSMSIKENSELYKDFLNKE